MSAFLPLLLLMGGSGFHSDSGDFSKLQSLSQMPLGEMAQPAKNEERAVDPKETTDTDSDPVVVRCRWQADRELLSNIGRNTDEKAVSKTGCTEEEKALVSGTMTGKKEIREKVVALANAEYPIVDMAESIAHYDEQIAGLIVGIAKKESDWGKHTPKLRGEECFNYWGYRGPGNRGMTEDGYGCFEKPSDAVETIGNRLVELSLLRQTTEPANMVIWKCGSSCAAHSPESVRKWISDVNIYYHQFAER